LVITQDFFVTGKKIATFNYKKLGLKAGLPDGLFSNQKSKLGLFFGGTCTRRCWYILWTLGPFYGLLLYFMEIWYGSWKFGVFFTVLVFCTKKNLATLP
jgi:hypothetical protein